MDKTLRVELAHIPGTYWVINKSVKEWKDTTNIPQWTRSSGITPVSQWRHYLLTKVAFINESLGQATKHCKNVYWNCVTKRRRVPKCYEKWAEDYPIFKMAENIWPNIFKLSFNTTRETKLQSFQYRIIHTTITCRKRLSDINLINSRKCLFGKEIDNIRHFLLFCPKVHNVWNSIFQW